MIKGKIGVFVARMQPLHKSHEFLIEQSMRENEKTYVFMGSADKSRTERNPFTIEERMGIFRKVFAEELTTGKIILVPLDDMSDETDTDNDKAWGQYLYDSIVRFTREKEFSLYYSDDPEIMLNWFTENLKKKINFRFFDRKKIFAELSATRIREALLDEAKTNSRKSNLYLKENLPMEVYEIREELAKILLKIA